MLGGETRIIDTPELIPELSSIDVHVNTGRKKSGMNLVSYAGHTTPELPRIPFIFDQYRHIRWYANKVNHPTLNRLYYSIAVERFRNGNLYFNDIRSQKPRLFEMDLLGRIVNEWFLSGYDYHHVVLELPNGNLLATATKHHIPTNQDFVLELDRETGAILTEWDLRESLDIRRLVWSSNPMDWFNGNALAYDEDNDAIIVSGRHQGTVKLSRNNEVIWILAPDREWDFSGNGTDLKTKLLQPLDANGHPITDFCVVSVK